MAGNVKGITIEFRGETTKLSSALRTIDKDTRSLDKELKGINNALKFNPTSVDLWRQKQTVLRDKIKETQDKLKLLKDEQARLDAKGVDKNSKEYRNLQREIITTESKLKTFKAQLRETGNAKLTALANQFKQVGDKVKAVGDKVKEVGKNLTTHLTGPLVALGGASVAAFKTVDEGLDIVVAKTGATGKALDDMKDSVKNLAHEIPTDFTTAGQAIGEVNTRFGLTGKELETLSGQFIKFAKLNNTDVITSVDQTQKALAAFGLSASDAGPLLDSLNVVGQQTGVQMGTLLQGLVQNATGFQELGLSAEQSAVLMGQMETSGANSETVMQGLRKALKNATEQGVPLDKALSDLQNTIVNGKGDVDGLTAAYDLFGKSGDQIYGAVKNGTLDFQKLSETTLNAGNSVTDTFNNTLSPTDQFTTAMNDLKTAGSELGSTLLESLVPAVQTLSDFIQMITDKWNSLSPGMQDAIVKIGLVLAVVGPLVAIIGTIISALGTVISVIGSVVSAIGMIFTPIGAVIAIIAAVIAAVIALVKNWDKVVAAAKALGAKVKAAFTAMKTAIGNIFKAIGNTISNIWTGIKTKVSSVVNNIKTAVTNAFKNLKTSVSNIFNSIKTTASNVWNKIKEAMSKPINKAKEIIKGAIDKIKSIFSGLKLKLPKFKLPHFHISGGKAPFGLGGKGSLPKFSVDWYAKGGIFDGASLIGVGEKGPEAVIPLDKLWTKMDKIAEGTGGDQIQINVYASPGMDVKVLAEEVERRLINSTNRRRLAWQ